MSVKVPFPSEYWDAAVIIEYVGDNDATNGLSESSKVDPFIQKEVEGELPLAILK